MVKRTIQLEHLGPLAAVDASTNALLEEATRAWVFGFARATVALARAAVEQGLRNHPAVWDGDDLARTIENCRIQRILDGAQCDMAHAVRRTANRVLHHADALELHEAGNILANARAVVRQLSAVDEGL